MDSSSYSSSEVSDDTESEASSIRRIHEDDCEYVVSDGGGSDRTVTISPPLTRWRAAALHHASDRSEDIPGSQAVADQMMDPEAMDHDGVASQDGIEESETGENNNEDDQKEPSEPRQGSSRGIVLPIAAAKTAAKRKGSHLPENIVNKTPKITEFCRLTMGVSHDSEMEDKEDDMQLMDEDDNPPTIEPKQGMSKTVVTESNDVGNKEKKTTYIFDERYEVLGHHGSGCFYEAVSQTIPALKHCSKQDILRNIDTHLKDNWGDIRRGYVDVCFKNGKWNVLPNEAFTVDEITRDRLHLQDRGSLLELFMLASLFHQNVVLYHKQQFNIAMKIESYILEYSEVSDANINYILLEGKELDGKWYCLKTLEDESSEEDEDSDEEETSEEEEIGEDDEIDEESMDTGDVGQQDEEDDEGLMFDMPQEKEILKEHEFLYKSDWKILFNPLKPEEMVEATVIPSSDIIARGFARPIKGYAERCGPTGVKEYWDPYVPPNGKFVAIGEKLTLTRKLQNIEAVRFTGGTVSYKKAGVKNQYSLRCWLKTTPTGRNHGCDSKAESMRLTKHFPEKPPDKTGEIPLYHEPLLKREEWLPKGTKLEVNAMVLTLHEFSEKLGRPVWMKESAPGCHPLTLATWLNKQYEQFLRSQRESKKGRVPVCLQDGVTMWQETYNGINKWVRQGFVFNFKKIRRPFRVVGLSPCQKYILYEPVFRTPSRLQALPLHRWTYVLAHSKAPRTPLVGDYTMPEWMTPDVEKLVPCGPLISDGPGVVYILNVKDSEEMYKIGCTNDLKKRLTNLKSSNGDIFNLVHPFSTDYRFFVEQIVHVQLKRFSAPQTNIQGGTEIFKGKEDLFVRTVGRAARFIVELQREGVLP